MQNLTDINVPHNSTSGIDGNGTLHISVAEQKKIVDIDPERLTETILAGENLSGQRVVCKLSSEVFYADKDEPGTIKTILGVTSGAVTSGEDAVIITSGPITEPSWSWDFPGLVFLGNQGQLTQLAPSSGARVIIGSVSSAITINVNISETITLI